MARLLDAVRPLTDKPLIVKLTPNASDVPAVALAAERAGASALSLINTIKGMALDPRTGSAVAGRRDRRRIRVPRCARSRWPRWPRSCRLVQIPVIGMGGVQSGR